MNSIHRTFYLLGFSVIATSGFRSHDQKKQLLSTCSIPLGACPTDQRSIETRTLCMNNFSSCPRATSYLCGDDSTGGYMVETCQPELKCLPGTTFEYIVNSKDLQVHLECVPCPGDRFEPEHTRSSLFSVIPGCTYKHLPPEQLSSHLVIYEFGSKSSAAKWTCDYARGYYERNGNLIINDISTHSYECVKKTCPAGTLLRPDGSCVKCTTKLIPEQKFICYEPLWKHEEYLSDEPVRPQQKPRIQESLQTSKNADSRVISDPVKAEGESQSTSPTVPAVSVTVSVIVLGFIAGVVWFVLRRRNKRGVRRRRQDRDSTCTQANDQQSPPENRTDESIEEGQGSTKNPQKSANDSSQHICDSHIENSVQARDIRINTLTINLHPGTDTKSKDETTPKTVLYAETEETKNYPKMKKLKSLTAEEDKQQTDPLLMHPLK